MTTHAWFPIPVYSSKATGKEYEKIQEELTRTYETTDFQQNPNWTGDTHDLSLGDSGKIFGDCLLKQKKCNNFISFIDKCISEYMNDLGIEKEYKNMLKKNLNDIGNCGWVNDIVSMKHENQFTRIFRT